MMDLMWCVEMVEESRDRTAETFPLPSVFDCIDYAICEAAEMLDALLRSRRTGDKRNNERQVDARAEWGQCGYMIASALIQTNYEPHTYYDEYADGQMVVYDCIHWLAREQMERDASLVDAMGCWVFYCQSQGWDAKKLLRETCAEFERKWCSTQCASPIVMAEGSAA